MRHRCVIGTLALIGSLAAGAMHAQDSVRVVADSINSGKEPARKSAAAAAMLGLVAGSAIWLPRWAREQESSMEHISSYAVSLLGAPGQARPMTNAPEQVHSPIS